MEKPLVTVGIPVRNCEKTIGETLDSIINQDYPMEQIEVVVVDDGCTDKTIPLIQGKLEFSKLRSRIFATGGKGLGESRQIIVENAHGKYIAWVDGDITLFPDFLAVQVGFMERNPQVWKARGRWEPHKAENLAEELENMTLVRYESKHSGKGRVSQKLVGIGGSVCRTEPLRNSGGFDRAIFGAGEDIDVGATMMEKGWLMSFTTARFYHKSGTTWRILWRRYFWYGYGSHYVKHKHEGFIDVWTRTAPVAFFSGFLQAKRVNEVAHHKKSLLLPLQYVYKQTAWLSGFVRAHLDGYGHDKPYGQTDGKNQ
ncbi:MAG: glycosyltransferase family A protein [Candidatus Bathyarchaeia archaeon]